MSQPDRKKKPPIDSLISSIQRRLYCQRLIRAFLWSACGLCLLAVLAMPLFWLFQGTDVRTTLLVIPGVIVGAIIASLVVTRRPTAAEAARAADRSIDGKDLFLTHARLRDSATPVGEFAPLVIREAESAATRVDPRRAAPIPMENSVGWAGGAIVAVIAAALLIPQFDPLGTERAAAALQEEKQLQNALDEETERLLADLRTDHPTAEKSPEIEKAITEFKKSLKRMQAKKPRENRRRLDRHQDKLGEKWRLKSAKALKKSLDRQSSSQQFGRMAHAEMLRKWKKELQQGSTDSLQREIESLKQKLKKLRKMEDPIKKQKALSEVQERMEALQQFAKSVAGSKQLSASLKRAMRQLEAARKAGASKQQQKRLAQQALKSAMQTLKLSKLQLEELGQTARDLKALEEALKTLQMAQQANAKKGLNGKKCQGCVTLADYRQIYKELLKRSGQITAGMGREGFGKGGKAPEDDSVSSDFTPEISKSAITAGKILLSLKTKGLSDSGQAEQDYAKQINTVKQGVSEAILHQQIPPGYHEEIKQYFDTLKAKKKGK